VHITQQEATVYQRFFLNGSEKKCKKCALEKPILFATIVKTNNKLNKVEFECLGFLWQLEQVPLWTTEK
jgi:hypothetical protein